MRNLWKTVLFSAMVITMPFKGVSQSNKSNKNTLKIDRSANAYDNDIPQKSKSNKYFSNINEYNIGANFMTDPINPKTNQRLVEINNFVMFDLLNGNHKNEDFSLKGGIGIGLNFGKFNDINHKDVKGFITGMGANVRISTTVKKFGLAANYGYGYSLVTFNGYFNDPFSPNTKDLMGLKLSGEKKYFFTHSVTAELSYNIKNGITIVTGVSGQIYIITDNSHYDYDYDYGYTDMIRRGHEHYFVPDPSSVYCFVGMQFRFR